MELTDNASMRGDVGESGDAQPTREGGGEDGGLRPEFGGLIDNVSSARRLIGLVGRSFGVLAVFFLITPRM